MKIIENSRFLKLPILLLLLTATIATGCSNSTSSGHDELQEPEGFVLKLNGESIVEQVEDSLSGQIEVDVDTETSRISLWFLDHDGEEFRPEDEEYSLQASFDPEGIAEFEQHEEDGKWSFHIHGTQVDTTYLTLRLMHGTHSDFDTKPVPVYVISNE